MVKGSFLIILMPAAVAGAGRVLQFNEIVFVPLLTKPEGQFRLNILKSPTVLLGAFAFISDIFYSLIGGIGGGGGGDGNFPYLFSKYSGLAFQTLILIFCVIPFFVSNITASSFVCLTAMA